VDETSVGEESVSEESVDADALLSRLRLIEDQPLETRAAAFAQINDELQSRLEGTDAIRPA
jgi:hypothetical protein